MSFEAERGYVFEVKLTFAQALWEENYVRAEALLRENSDLDLITATDYESCRHGGETPDLSISFPVWVRMSEETTLWLLHHGMNITAKILIKEEFKDGVHKADHGWTLLMDAVLRDRLRVVEKLLVHSDIEKIINAQDYEGKTALMLAAEKLKGYRLYASEPEDWPQERDYILKRLLCSPADRSIRSNAGSTFMDYVEKYHSGAPKLPVIPGGVNPFETIRSIVQSEKLSAASSAVTTFLSVSAGTSTPIPTAFDAAQHSILGIAATIAAIPAMIAGALLGGDSAGGLPSPAATPLLRDGSVRTMAAEGAGSNMQMLAVLLMTALLALALAAYAGKSVQDVRRVPVHRRDAPEERAVEPT